MAALWKLDTSDVKNLTNDNADMHKDGLGLL